MGGGDEGHDGGMCGVLVDADLEEGAVVATSESVQ